MKRINNLDYLRGICALFIMLYHYMGFNFKDFSFVGKDASLFINKMAIYGVSVFYILSGFTLYYVYHNYDFRKPSMIKEFIIKRAFRIIPLYSLLCFLVVFVFLKPSLDIIGWKKFIFNITGLFSVFDYTQYILMGGWSIGNELVFYLFFPFVMLFLGRNNIMFYCIFIASFILYCVFAYKLQPKALNWWYTYIIPFNQIFLFFSGIFIGLLTNKQTNKHISIYLIFITISIFIYYPVDGGLVSIVSGNNRLIFSVLSILIVFLFYRCEFNLPKYVDFPLRFLGEISYGVYLIHPIVYTHIVSEYFILDIYAKISLSIILTVFFSALSYYSIEKFFIRLGKKYGSS